MQGGPVGLAVFGAGRIGTVHASNAARLRGARLVGVADIDRDAARRVVDTCGSGRVDDVRALLADPEVRGVVVATPTGTHASLVAQAADAGKHILCEKPIALDLAGTRAAAESAERAKVLLQVGFQRRFDSEFMLARESVETAKIGTPRFLRMVGRDHFPPTLDYLRTSGGQYVDQMIHEFDLVRWLMSPARANSVFAAGSALIEPELDKIGDADTTVAVLQFDTGALGVIDGSREAAYGYDVRGEIHGSKGLFLIGHERLRNGRLLDNRVATPDVNSFIERFEDAYRAELEDFVEAIALGRKPRVGADDAFEALRLALAATRSFRERRPIELSEVSDA